ncbi:SURF1 family protein [Polynucleobacter paneuropaeus]|nr:SURF1 family protein [Polynucleobacter paneuropaeus]
MNIFSSLVTKRIVATLAVLITIIICSSAGFWQLRRAHEKIMLAANLVTKQQMPILNANAQNWTLEEVNQRRMRAQGAFLSEEVVWLDNRPRPVNKDGEAAPAGFYVMMPLRLENGQILWVNRGWAPRNGLDRVALPAINTPKGVVSIEGTVFATPGKVYEFGNSNLGPGSKPRIQQNLVLEQEAKNHGWTQSPYILREVQTGQADGLVREWAPLTTGVDRHYAYAFQWFALAACAFLFWLVTGLRQYRKLSGSISE